MTVTIAATSCRTPRGWHCATEGGCTQTKPIERSHNLLEERGR